MTVLRTPRLLLRPKRAEDFEAVHRIASAWEVVRWTATWPWPPDPAFTAMRVGGGQPEEGLIASVEHEGTLVGMATVMRGELGYFLAPGAWGRGFATEACGALVAHAFATTGWPAVTAGVFEGNDASLRVLAKLGFRETGRSVGACRAQGRELPMVDLAVGREDWRPGA